MYVYVEVKSWHQMCCSLALYLIFKMFLFCLCMYVRICLCAYEYVDIIGQLVGVDFLFLPCKSWGSNLGHRAWQEAPSLALSHLIDLTYYFLMQGPSLNLVPAIWLGWLAIKC